MLNCSGNTTPSPQQQCLVWKPGREDGVINRAGWEFFNKIGLSSDMADLLKPKVFAEIWGGVQADSTWLRQVLEAAASFPSLLPNEYLITDIKWNSSSRRKIPSPLEQPTVLLLGCVHETWEAKDQVSPSNQAEQKALMYISHFCGVNLLLAILGHCHFLNFTKQSLKVLFLFQPKTKNVTKHQNFAKRKSYFLASPSSKVLSFFSITSKRQSSQYDFHFSFVNKKIGFLRVLVWQGLKDLEKFVLSVLGSICYYCITLMNTVLFKQN